MSADNAKAKAAAAPAASFGGPQPEPEVFESPDLAAEVQEGPRTEAPVTESDEDVVKDGIDVVRARELFKDRTLGSEGVSGVDKNRGYTSYSIAESGALYESLPQKFNRLRAEVTGFMEQLDAASKAAKGEGDGADGDSALKMLNEMSALRDQLQQVRLDEMLGEGSAPLDTTPGVNADVAKRLTTEVGKLKGAQPAPTDEKAKGPVTYELYLSADQAAYERLARAAALEQRIAVLERCVGNENLGPVANFLDVPDISLKSSVVALAERVDALSEDSLGDLERQLVSVGKQLDDMKDKQAALLGQAPEHADKVRELYELTRKWDATAAVVPALVARLKELRNVHEQAATFSTTLTHMSTVQETMRDQLATQGVTLDTLEETMKKNTATIEGNFASMEKRVEALLAKLS